MNSDKRYIIGIDLGTTNSAVSYVDLQSRRAKDIRIFRIPQLTGAGEFSPLPVLPSFLYIPGTYDIPKEAIEPVPWKSDDLSFVGAFARDHGTKVPARLVSSAKSWLCHSKADRRAKILPWGAGSEVYKVSPVQASAAYLKHIRNAWNTSKGDDEDQYIENQMVIITVPASFDEAARDLTVEASEIAGLKNVTLLEEPLAAFYNWLIRHEQNWNEFVSPGELILVCDVGGGTTDFTLITLRDVEGHPRFERIAVGDHLILGGDNIDLALARRIEIQFSNKKLSLTTEKWKTLCHQCRQAKEKILNRETESQKIILMGEGRKLIAQTMSADLKRKDVEDTVLEGFFPLVEPEAEKREVIRKGITEFGLPYEQEPAITRQMGWFLERHKIDVKTVLNRNNYAPDLILFNGGSLKSDIVQERIRAAIRKWFNIDDTSCPRVLENPDPDLAVALGASYYGLVKIGHGVRVGSGSSRSFYLGVQTPPLIPPKGGIRRNAICIVERGLEEGSHIELKDKTFEVLANQPVSFDLYSSSFRSGDRCGDLLEIDDSMTPLPPIRTVVQYGKKGIKQQLPVMIEAEFTEIGTLALWCRSKISDHRWQMRFQLRDMNGQASVVSEREIFEDSIIKAVREKVRSAFSNPSEIESVVKDISEIVDRHKEKWTIGLIRSIADELLNNISARNIRPEMEIRWQNLIGYCLRPGFGDGFDEHRLKALWKIYKNGTVYSNNQQVRSEWWIMWRRVAGGLTSGQQRQFIQDITQIMLTKKGKKIPPQEYTEIWMAVANMERLLVKDKIKWGRQLLSEINPKKSKAQYLWALSRIGARELLYGPVDRVIPPAEVSSWIKTLISYEWSNPKPCGLALLHISRKTGDRMRDIEPKLADQIINWLIKYNFSENHIRVLNTVIPMATQEQNIVFGESLPSGIVISQTDALDRENSVSDI